MESELPTVIKLLERSSEGSEEALETLGLNGGHDYSFPRPFDPQTSSKITLEEHLIQTLFFAAAARKLGLDGCEKAASMARRHMLYTNSCLYNKNFNTDEPLDGQELSEDMLNFMRELCRTMDMLKTVKDNEAQKDAKNARAAKEQTVTGQKVKREEESDKEMKSMKASAERQQKVTGQKVKRDEESDQESDDSIEDAYDPAKDSNAGESSSEDDSSADKYPGTSNLLPPTKRTKLSASPSTFKSSPATKTTSASTSPQLSGIRSHHKKKQRPVPKCTFHSNDLRRHLNVHVKRGDVASDSVDRLLSIVRAGEKQRGKVQARKRRKQKGQNQAMVPSSRLQPSSS